MGLNSWVGVAATIINVLIVVIYLFAPRRHHHDWSNWDQWIISKNHFEAEGIRYRRCHDCAKVEQQESGYHKCFDHKCKHLDFLFESEVSKIKRMEKELGL